MQSKVIEKFLSKCNEQATVTNYKSHLKYFFDFIGKKPDEYIKDTRLMENGDRIKLHDMYEDDIGRYQSYLIKKKRTPSTVKGTMGVLRIFFRRNRIQLDDGFWDDIRRSGSGSDVITEDRKPTKEELRKILDLGGVLERGLFLTLSSSGMRPIELSKIIVNDVHLNEKPARMHIRPTTKTDKGRDVYISDEAVNAINAWLGIRNDWIIQMVQKCSNLVKEIDGVKIKVTKKIDDNRLFPIRSENMQKRWNVLLGRAALNQKDAYSGRNVLHLYTLRKYYRSNFGDADKAEALMGHINAYRRFSPVELERSYLENVKNLKVYETSGDTERINHLDEQLKEKDTAISDLREEMQERKMDILELRLTLQELKNKKK